MIRHALALGALLASPFVTAFTFVALVRLCAWASGAVLTEGGRELTMLMAIMLGVMGFCGGFVVIAPELERHR